MCKCKVVSIRRGHRIARGWRYTKPSLASTSFCVARVLYVLYVTHPYEFTGPLRVAASYLSFLIFAFLLSFYRFCPVFMSMLLLKLCTYIPLIFFRPPDHVPDWQLRIVLGMAEARSVNVYATHTHTHTQVCCTDDPLHVRSSSKKIDTDTHLRYNQISRVARGTADYLVALRVRSLETCSLCFSGFFVNNFLNT